MIRKTNMAVLALIVVMATISLPLNSTVLAKQSSPSNQTTAKVENVMQQMSLEEKVGQLFIVHVYGKTPTDSKYEQTNLNNDRGGKNFKEIIEKYHVGGVIYFNWTDNITKPLDAAQVNGLSNGIQKVAMDDNGIPLFISTDQEGGIVQRVAGPATVFPGNMALGATKSKYLASASAGVIGNELNSLGINMDFAPSLDVNMNPKNPVIGVRSYGENPQTVSDLGVAQIKAYQAENVMATAKHFPGHGDTATDSHYGLPIINHDLKTLHDIDLKPFKAAIDAGVDAIMSAHIVVPALDDSGLPATLSKPILTDLLRGEMRFDGLVITDSLDMSGADVVPDDRIAVEAFKAGADVLLNPPDVPVAYNSVLKAVQNGEISEKRLDASVSRILKKKMESELFDQPYTKSDAIENIGTMAHLQLANEVAEKSVTLVKTDDNLLPLKENKKVFITGPTVANPDQLTRLLKKNQINTDFYATATSPTKEQIDTAVSKSSDADVVIVPTYSANTNINQQKLVEAMQKTGKKVIVAAMQNPYDLMAFPKIDAYLTTYSYMDVSVAALAKVLAGEVNPSGKLPVTIPDLYPRDHGLDYIGPVKSTKDIQVLINKFVESGGIVNDKTAHKLSAHLDAVKHFEQSGKPEKVIKHLDGFKLLLEHEKDSDLINAKAFGYLDTATDKELTYWRKK